ncbi:MAG: NADH-quinone oxidoreductase subunit N [Candidatus Marsarchaeota archaeon]|jgi:NADH-quinone oxidoreductase subunit N|nr:NADH-quinone oxidoreductase subunit N [Candidatus Marsarchaeota archaeon]
MYAYVGYLIAALLGLLVISGITFKFNDRRRLLFGTSVTIFAAILIISLVSILYGVDVYLFGLLHIYQFSLLFVSLFSFAFILVEILGYGSDNFELFNMFVGIAAAGVFLVVMAYSILTIFIAIELVSISTIMMIMTGGKRSVESATKLFILSSISISVFAFAMVLMLPYDGTLSLSLLSMNSSIGGDYIILLSMLMFIAALSIDASLFPFNLWVADVYQGAQDYVTPMLSGINKKVAFVALIYILFIVFASYSHISSVILEVVAVATMFFGNLVAMVQSNVKRMFAYSSISQAGYILIGITTFSAYGLEASVFQIFAHVFMTIGAFAIVMWMESKGIRSVDDYKGMEHRNFWAFSSLTLIMLSMAGIPPLMGFFGKFLLFSSAISSGLLALAFIGIINSFISIYYYGKLISSMLRDTDKGFFYLGRNVRIVVYLCLIAIIAFGVYPHPLLSVISKSVSSLIH